MIIVRIECGMIKFLQIFLRVSTIVIFVVMLYLLFNLNFNFEMARSSYPVGYLFVGLLFFNTTHIFISALSMKYLPEFNSLTFLRTREFKIRCALIFLGTCLLAFMAESFAREILFTGVILKVFIYTATTHHTNMQTYGLSIQNSYGSAVNKVEKIFVLTATFISALSYFFVRSGYQRLGIFLLPIILVMWLVASIYILKKTKLDQIFDKTIYLLRYCTVFMCFIHPIFTLMTMIFHGMEYVCHFLILRKNSSLSREQYVKSSIGLWLLVPATALFIHIGAVGYLSGTFIPKGWIAFFAVITLGLNVLHFYTDYRSYQFKNREIREKIYPLLNQS
jgi:hypothetical protein